MSFLTSTRGGLDELSKMFQVADFWTDVGRLSVLSLTDAPTTTITTVNLQTDRQTVALKSNIR